MRAIPSVAIEDDATAVTGLVADDMDRWGVWVNGKRDSLLPWGGIHTLLGGIPALVHGPFPRGMAQADEHVEIEEYLHIVRMHVLSAFDYLSR